MKTPIRLIIILAWAVTLGVASYGCRMDKRVNRNIQLTEDADESATE